MIDLNPTTFINHHIKYNSIDVGLNAQELEELFGKVDLEKVLKDEIVAEIKEQHDKHLLNTLMDGRIEK